MVARATRQQRRRSRSDLGEDEDDGGSISGRRAQMGEARARPLTKTAREVRVHGGGARGAEERRWRGGSR
jgi:hypothetical protein